MRVLNEYPDSLYAGSEDNSNLTKIIDKIMRQRRSDEFLRDKFSKIADEIPVPFGVHLA
jgi:hypothetical protein